VIDRWRLDYNHCRIHTALNYQTPAAYAAPLCSSSFGYASASRTQPSYLTPILSLRLVERRRHYLRRHLFNQPAEVLDHLAEGRVISRIPCSQVPGVGRVSVQPRMPAVGESGGDVRKPSAELGKHLVSRKDVAIDAIPCNVGTAMLHKLGSVDDQHGLGRAGADRVGDARQVIHAAGDIRRMDHGHCNGPLVDLLENRRDRHDTRAPIQARDAVFQAARRTDIGTGIHGRGVVEVAADDVAGLGHIGRRLQQREDHGGRTLAPRNHTIGRVEECGDRSPTVVNGFGHMTRSRIAALALSGKLSKNVAACTTEFKVSDPPAFSK